MSVFEQLRPFVSLCQACGVIPFTIERNLTTGKFKRFAFSLRHFAAWWFLLILILHISIIAIVKHMNNDMQNILSADRNIPTTMIILSGITSSTYLAQLISPRWIAMNYRHLANAVEALQKAETLLGEKFIAEHKSSVVTRFVAGFVIILLTTIGAMFALESTVTMFLPENLSVFSITAFFIVIISLQVAFDCSLLFLYVCYYIIAHYIQLISLRCNEEDDNAFQVAAHKGAVSIKTMRRNALIFDYLCRAASEINSIFSLSAFFFLIVKFVTIITTAYAYAYRFIYTNAVLESTILLYPFLIITETIRILLLFVSVDMPVNQFCKVYLLHEHLTAMSLCGISKTSAEKMTMMTLLVQIDVERVQLSALGLFKVGMHLIPAITSAVVTYMVILLQN